MKLTAKGIEILRSPLGVMLMIPASHNNELEKIKTDKEYDIEIKERRKHRSLNAWSIVTGKQIGRAHVWNSSHSAKSRMPSSA